MAKPTAANNAAKVAVGIPAIEINNNTFKRKFIKVTKKGFNV